MAVLGSLARTAWIVNEELVVNLLRLEPIALLLVRPQARNVVHAQAEIRHWELGARCCACRGIVLRQRDYVAIDTQSPHQRSEANSPASF